MTNYEFLKNIDEALYYELINRGVIPINVMTYKTIYESFLSELKKNKKSVAITFCADKYSVTERTIRNVIKFMECTNEKENN